MGIRESERLIKSEFVTDNKGNPTGGETHMELPGFNFSPVDIIWQNGIVGEDGQNGAFVEDVIEAARQRLLFFNTTKFRCRENSVAITKLEEALQWLDWRTRQRLIANVENSYETH